MNGQKQPTHCVICGAPLVRVGFKRSFVLVCDNWRCGKYRQPQYIESIGAAELPFMTKRGKYIFRERERASGKNIRKRERYQYARDHGLPSTMAGAICGNSMRYINDQIALFEH